MKIRKTDGTEAVVDASYQLQAGESVITDAPTFDITANLKPAFDEMSKNLSGQVEAAMKKINDDFARFAQTSRDDPKPIAAGGGKPPVSVGDAGWVRYVQANRKSKKKDEYCDKELRFFRGIAASMQGGVWNPAIGLAAGDLELADTLIEGTASLGGTLVPQEFILKVIAESNKYSQILNFVNWMPTQTDTVNLAGLATGATAYVVGEASAVTRSNPTFGAPTVTIKKIGAEITMSRELLMDAMSVGTQLEERLANARAKLLESEIVSGSSLCTGFLSLSNPQVEPADQNNLTFDDFNNLMALIRPDLRSQAIILASSLHAARIRNIKGLDNHPIFKQTLASPMGDVMGIPLVESYSMPNPDAVDAGENFVAMMIPSRLIWAFQRMGASVSIVTSGLDSASQNRDTQFLASMYLWERAGVTNYASLDDDGENHVYAVLQQG